MNCALEPNRSPARPIHVYFYCRDEETNFQEDVVTLAEGLRELGVSFHSNCDYWRRSIASDDYLLQADADVRPDDCDVVVVSYTWPSWIQPRTFKHSPRPLPKDLFRRGRSYRTVYMDHHDGHRTISWEPQFRQFDLILRCKLNRRAWHPSNMRPWAYGLTNRVLEATKYQLPYAKRRHAMLWNFGASHSYPHGTRDRAEKVFGEPIAGHFPLDRTKDDLSVAPTDAYDALMWRQTGYRHSPHYFKRLLETKAVACFCGDLIPPMPFERPERYLVGGNRAKLRRAMYDFLALFDSRPQRSVQWDSFRFWETLAAGALAINLDLDHYGVQMPVMPENWVHYVGIDLDQPRNAIERIASDPGLPERIARAGQAWALHHYSPRAMATRFLKMLELGGSSTGSEG